VDRSFSSLAVAAKSIFSILSKQILGFNAGDINCNAMLTRYDAAWCVAM
jgi:hypothetical protein